MDIEPLNTTTKFSSHENMAIRDWPSSSVNTNQVHRFARSGSWFSALLFIFLLFSFARAAHADDNNCGLGAPPPVDCTDFPTHYCPDSGTAESRADVISQWLNAYVAACAAEDGSAPPSYKWFARLDNIPQAPSWLTCTSNDSDVVHACDINVQYLYPPPAPTLTGAVAEKNTGDPDCDCAGHEGRAGGGSKATGVGVAGSSFVGDPIDVATGNEYLQEDDYSESSWLTFRRFYNSDPSIVSATMGAHWRHSFERLLQLSGPSGTTVTAVRPDGKREIFTRSGSQWLADSNNPDTLTETDDSSGVATGYALFIASLRHVESYDANGFLQTVLDGSGQGIALAYSTTATDPSVAPIPGLLLTVTDSFGRQLQFTYTAARLVHHLTLPDGKVVTYVYDSYGRLTSTQYADTKTRQYLYNESSLTSGANLLFALTGVQDEAGVRYESIGYDTLGHAISSSAAGGAGATAITYNSDGTSTVQYPLGSSATMGFATANGVVSGSTVDQACGPDCNQPWKTRTYDINGYPASYTDFNNRQTTTQYNAYGLLHIETDAVGTTEQRTTTTTWDGTLRVPLTQQVQNAQNTVVSKEAWVYNVLGKVHVRCEMDPAIAAAAGYACSDTGTPPTGVRRWIFHYCGSVDTTQCPIEGLLLNVDGPRTDVSDVTTYTYYMLDGVNHHHGDLKSVTDPLGHVTTYLIYDGAGRVTAMQRPDGTYVDFTYTPRGWLLTRTIRVTSDNSPASSDATTTLQYTAYGAVDSVTDADGVVTTFKYDTAHRLTDIYDDTGENIHYTLDAAGNKTGETTFTAAGAVTRSLARHYNTLGQLTTLIDGLSQTVFQAADAGDYDANGNLLLSTDNRGYQRQRGYDALNRLNSTIDNYNGTDASTKNSQTVMHHDALDRLDAVGDPDSLNTLYNYDGLDNRTSLQSPDTGSSSDTYDAAGNRLTHTDAKGIVSTSSYDADNRRVATTYADTTLNVSYHYDEDNSVTGCASSRPIGRLTRVVEGSVTTAYCYGGHGVVTQKRQTTAGHLDLTNYGYTPATRLASVQSPDGTLTSYSYNANGQLSGAQVTPAGTSTASPTVVSNITWMPFGPISGYTLGNGQVVVRSYDKNYQLTDLTSPAFTLHLKHDGMGDITGIGNAPGANPATETYGYDPLYRLSSVTDGSSTLESYTYDKTGDRLSKTAPGLATGAYGYATGTHRLTSVGTTTRGVDANGNTTSSTVGADSYVFGYNGRNRMSTVQRDGSAVASYTYNALGQRIGKTATFPQSIAERYAYDEAGHLIGEYGSTNRDYLWLGDIPVAVIDNTTVGSVTSSVVNYVTADQLGTPRAVTNSADTVIWSWAYQGNPFGEQQPTSATGYVLNLRFPGQYYDAESGTSYNYFRNYEASTGRYLESDPAGLMGGVSTFAYVKNDPADFIDPDGLAQTSGPRTPSSKSWRSSPGVGGVYGRGVPNGPSNQPPSDPEQTPGAWGNGSQAGVDRCVQGYCTAKSCDAQSSSISPLRFIGRPPSEFPTAATLPRGCTCTHWKNSDDILPLPEPSANGDDWAEMAARAAELRRENQRALEENLSE